MNRPVILAVLKARGLAEIDATGQWKLTDRGREFMDCDKVMRELAKPPPREEHMTHVNEERHRV